MIVFVCMYVYIYIYICITQEYIYYTCIYMCVCVCVLHRNTYITVLYPFKHQWMFRLFYAFMNNAAINAGVQISLQDTNFFSFGYILQILSPCHIWFANNIFSHFLDSLFILLMVTFVLQKLFSLMQSHLLFLLLLPVILVSYPKNDGQDQNQDLSPYVLS